jgi:hypothetical protein
MLHHAIVDLRRQIQAMYAKIGCRQAQQLDEQLTYGVGRPRWTGDLEISSKSFDIL